MPRPRSWLVLLLLAALVGGCASLSREPPTDWGPDAKLDWWLKAWFAQQGAEAPSSDAAPRPAPRATAWFPRDDVAPLPEWIVRAGVRRTALEYPDHVPTLVANGALALASGDMVAAEQWLDDALSLDPARVDAAVLRARVWAESGNLPGAERTLRRVLLVRPDAPEIHEALAGVLYLQGDLDGAEGELELAGQLGATSARLCYHRGLLAERDGRLRTAASWYRKAVDADPDFTAAWHRLAGLQAAQATAVLSNAGP